jgi:hypothetical protein
MKHIKKYEEININILDDEEFYGLMQIYRHTPLTNQKYTIDAFENIKKFINDNFIVKNEKVVKDWLLKQDAKKYNL